MTGQTVVVNAAIRSGGDVGGVEQFVIGLIDGLAQVNEGTDFLLVTDPDDPAWIEPYMGPRMRTVQRPARGWHERLPIPRAVKDAARPVKRAVFGRDDGDDASPPPIPDWGEFVRELGADMVYFPFQDFAHTGVPCVYNPHDLQHRHYPEFFSRTDRRRREQYFETGCTDSVAVDVPSRATKEDVVSAYGISPEDVYVIPRAPPVQVYDPIDDAVVGRTRQRHDLPERFAFYPAQTWPHKNHERLLDALARLRDRDGQRVHLVCTGKRNDHWPEVRARIDALGLSDQVQFLGYVPTDELQALYRLCTFLVFPSLFEGGGFPLLEAWDREVPVTCSDRSALGEKAGDAALLFDPCDVDDIARAVGRMATDDALRDSLRTRGTERVSRFTWSETAEVYIALFRQVTGGALSGRERSLLERARAGTLVDE